MAVVKVLIPTPLQKYTDNCATVESTASTISELFDALESQYPDVKGRLRDENGEPRRFINFYVRPSGEIDSEDIRFLDGTKTALQDGDEVSIVPAVAGG